MPWRLRDPIGKTVVFRSPPRAEPRASGLLRRTIPTRVDLLSLLPRRHGGVLRSSIPLLGQRGCPMFPIRQDDARFTTVTTIAIVVTATLTAVLGPFLI